MKMTNSDGFMTRLIPRDGQLPLRIAAELIAKADTRISPGGKTNSRWTEARIYRTEDGGYAAHILGRSSHKGERDRQWGAVSADAKNLIDIIIAHYGSLHMAVQMALEKAGLYLASSVRAEEDIVVDETKTSATIIPLGRQRKERIKVNLRPKEHLITIVAPNALTVSDAERLAFGMLRAIEISRDGRGGKT